MDPARVGPEIACRSEELQKLAADLYVLGKRLREIPNAPIRKGSTDLRGIQWRCQAIARANLLRGQELLRFAILAINEGALITAHVLARALDETCAAVISARAKIERAIMEQDQEQLIEVLNRSTCGSRYMADRNSRYPEPYNVLTMIDETGRYQAELIAKGDPATKQEFRKQYEFLSETVHPSMGSFSLYQDSRGEEVVFSRVCAQRVDPIPMLLLGLRASAALLLSQADALSSLEDLPEGWGN